LFSEIIKKYDSLEDAARELVNIANENGGRDNITVVILKCID